MPEFTGRLRTPRLTGAAPASPVPGEMYYDNDDNKLYWYNGTSWIDSTGGAGTYTPPAYSATFPSSPTDAQEFYYIVDATARVIWHLRYNASGGTYKWEMLGGPPITAYSTTRESSGGGVWHAGPVLTIPRAGDYLLGFNASLDGVPNSGMQTQWSMTLGDGTSMFSPTDAFTGRYYFVQPAGNPANRTMLGLQNALVASLAAGTTIKLKATVVNWDYGSDNRRISALPVRLA